MASFYKIENLTEVHSLPKEGFWLLLGPLEVGPPHLALVFQNYYFDITVKGSNSMKNADTVFSVIDLKKHKYIFIEIKSNLEEQNLNILQSNFYSKNLGVDYATCLGPIKSSLEAIFGISLKEVNYVYELIPLLEEKGFTGRKIAYNFNPKEGYSMPLYSLDDILQRIQILEKK